MLQAKTSIYRSEVADIASCQLRDGSERYLVRDRRANRSLMFVSYAAARQQVRKLEENAGS